jgi:hypothetical protein
VLWPAKKGSGSAFFRTKMDDPTGQSPGKPDYFVKHVKCVKNLLKPPQRKFHFPACNLTAHKKLSSHGATCSGPSWHYLQLC